MTKDFFWFPHDVNADNDPKIAALISIEGMAGYGFYWFLVGKLHNQSGYLNKFPRLYDGLAKEANMTREAVLEQIEALLQDYELLKQDEKNIWSERVLRNINFFEQSKQQKKDAGKRGGINSGISRKTKRCLKTAKQNEAPLEKNEAERSETKHNTIHNNTIHNNNYFKTFWEKYPPRNGSKPNKQETEIEFENISQTDYDHLFNSLEKFKLSEDWKKDNGKWIPSPINWLTKKRWMDYEYSEEQPIAKPELDDCFNKLIQFTNKTWGCELVSKGEPCQFKHTPDCLELRAIEYKKTVNIPDMDV